MRILSLLLFLILFIGSFFFIWVDYFIFYLNPLVTYETQIRAIHESSLYVFFLKRILLCGIICLLESTFIWLIMWIINRIGFYRANALKIVSYYFISCFLLCLLMSLIYIKKFKLI